jgi:hypothetical protein
VPGLRRKRGHTADGREAGAAHATSQERRACLISTRGPIYPSWRCQHPHRDHLEQHPRKGFFFFRGSNLESISKRALGHLEFQFTVVQIQIQFVVQRWLTGARTWCCSSDAWRSHRETVQKSQIWQKGWAERIGGMKKLVILASGIRVVPVVG